MAGRTWKEVKAEIERAGVRDEDRVIYIDVGYNEPIQVRREPNSTEVEIVSG